MIPIHHDAKDFKIFAAFKVGNDYNIVALPQVLSVQYKTDYVRRRKEYIIEWQQDIYEPSHLNRSDFLIMLSYNKLDKKIDTEILHTFAFDYSYCFSTGIPTETTTYKCRYAVNPVPTPDEEMIVNVLNDYFKQKLNKLRSNDIDIMTMGELSNRSDNMADTFNTLDNAVCRISIGSDNMANTFVTLRNAVCGTIIAMPTIIDIYYNAPHTTVKWSDGTTTTVAATSGEEFNKEIGLAMAISRKYCKCIGLSNPRAGFKRMVNNANDQTAKTAARKAYKNSKKLLKAADISNEESSDHGLDSNS